MTHLQNQRNVTLSHVCVSMQSVQYCNSHLSHMDIFSGSNLVQQRAQTSPSSPTRFLIIIVLLCRCGPYMCRYVFPRTIWRVPYLSSNQKLLQMQEYTHVLMQLRTGSPPYATSSLHSRGSPKEGEQNQKSKPTLGVTMMPLRAPSITKYGSLVRPDAQIVALRAHCA